jgi:ribosomal protein S27E
MTAIRSAKKRKAAVFVDCPYCGTPFPSPGGDGFLWTHDVIAARTHSFLKCASCDRTSWAPSGKF